MSKQFKRKNKCFVDFDPDEYVVRKTKNMKRDRENQERSIQVKDIHVNQNREYPINDHVNAYRCSDF